MLGNGFEFEGVVRQEILFFPLSGWIRKTGASGVASWEWRLGFRRVERVREFCTSGDGAGQVSSVHQ